MLVAFDCDDTLLNNDLQLTQYTKDVLRRLVSDKHYVVLASGRSMGAMKRIVEDLGIQKTEYGRYLIYQNGCRIWDFLEDKSIFDKLLPFETCLKVYSIANEEGVPCEVYIDDILYASFKTEFTDVDTELTGLRQVNPESYVDILKLGHAKIVLAAAPERIERVSERFSMEMSQEVSYCRSKPFILEVLSPNWGKGEALEILCNKIGIDKGSTIAIGDSQNDISMIEFANLGIAMKNAMPELKRVASCVTEYSNNEDGAARYIEDIIYHKH